MPLMRLAAPLVGPSKAPVLALAQFSTSDVDFGDDITVFPDLDDSLTPKGGRLVVADALARRFITDRGALWMYPDYGRDLRLYLNAGPITTDTLAAIKSDVQDQALQDERILSAKATVSYDSRSSRLRVRLSASTDAGPFSLTLDVSKLTVDLLTGT